MKVPRWIAVSGVYGAILAALAGRLDLPFLWAYWGVGALGALALILTIDPDLAQERRRPGPGGVDRHRRFFFGFFFLAHLVIGVLDLGRFHWSDTVPAATRIAGLAGYAAALGWLAWSVAVNRFFSPVVRIQAERGHHLITRGPYRYVRHPGYLALVVLFPASALALGSWWSLAPALVNVALVFHRAAIEDRYLMEHLTGYAGYAGTVSYRLVPGIW